MRRIVECGKQTERPPIRDILRKAYSSLYQAHRVSLTSHAEWRENLESYSLYKAQGLADYASAVDQTFDAAESLLCAEETEKLRALNQKEKIRAFRLGDEAKKRFQEQIFRRNAACYFGLEQLLLPL